MPIYEFKCQECGEVTEKWQKMSDPYPTECPVCHKGKLQKIMSPTGFTLKGSGWYVTDFRDKSSSKPAPTTATPSTPTASSSETSSSDSSTTEKKSK